MKKQSPGIFLLVLLAGSLLFFPSCKKINEATELGGSLIPPVDNITTFETLLSTETDNKTGSDTTHQEFMYFPVAIGNIVNDQEFGGTHAAAYFNVGLVTYGSNPFLSSSAILGVDSVVLSLAYAGRYGDSLAQQTVRVYEIAPASPFNDTTLYTYNDAPFGIDSRELGSRTFSLASLDDSMLLVRKDTQRVANVLRIRLDTNLAKRFAGFDVATAYGSDLAFKTAFKGLAVIPDSTSGNGLGYFDLTNITKSVLSFYVRLNREGRADTATINFIHARRSRDAAGTLSKGGKANIIRRKPAGAWAAALANGTPADEVLYFQSQPGSYATVKIPGLDSLAGTNRLIHLAELVIPRIPTASDHLFPSPSRLFLNRMSPSGDTLFNMERDFPLSALTPPFASFGGALRSDSTYRFNITRYVQDVANGRLPANHILRVSAPYRTVLFDKVTGKKEEIFVNDLPAKGRTVAGGGNNADPARRMRLRLVYSKTQP